MREARLTVSPMTVRSILCCEPISPKTAGPRPTPTPRLQRANAKFISRYLMTARRSFIFKAARTAFRAFSSWLAGRMAAMLP